MIQLTAEVITLHLDPMASQLRRLLSELSRVTQLLERTEGGCCGVSLAQCHLLGEISSRQEEPPALSDLAQTLGVDLSTMSRVADGLVRQGMVTRETDPADRRRSVIGLTDCGRQLVQTIDGSMNEYSRAVLEEIPEDQRSSVFASLDLLVRALGKARSCC